MDVSQGDSTDLVSLKEICLEGELSVAKDVETEQLLNEIELLTSRAMQETNQARNIAGNDGNLPCHSVVAFSNNASHQIHDLCTGECK